MRLLRLLAALALCWTALGCGAARGGDTSPKVLSWRAQGAVLHGAGGSDVAALSLSLVLSRPVARIRDAEGAPSWARLTWKNETLVELLAEPSLPRTLVAAGPEASRAAIVAWMASDSSVSRPHGASQLRVAVPAAGLLPYVSCSDEKRSFRSVADGLRLWLGQNSSASIWPIDKKICSALQKTARHFSILPESDRSGESLPRPQRPYAANGTWAKARAYLCDGDGQRESRTPVLLELDTAERARSVGMVLKPLLDNIVQPVFDQIMGVMVADLRDQVTQHVERAVEADTPEMVTAHVGKALIANLSRILPDSVTGEASTAVADKMVAQYAPDLSSEILEHTKPPVEERLVEQLTDKVSDKVDTELPMDLERSLGPLLTNKLTQSVTQSLIPSVLLGTRNAFPALWEFPRCKDSMCRYHNAEIARYYTMYHSMYNSHYYGSYASDYYTNAQVAVDDVLFKGMSPEDAATNSVNSGFGSGHAPKTA